MDSLFPKRHSSENTSVSLNTPITHRHGKKHKNLLHSLRCSIVFHIPVFNQKCNRIPSTNTLLHCTSCGDFYVCEHCFFASNHAMNHSFVRVCACHYPLPPNSTEKETYCFCEHPSVDPNVEILPLLPKAVPIPLERDYFGHTRTSHHNRNHESNLFYT